MNKKTVVKEVVEQIPDKMSEGFDKIMSPFESFIQDEVTGSVLLIACMLLALIFANSPWANDYDRLIHMHLGIIIGDIKFEKTVQHWVNDGLMALFFLVIGMEIKRELLAGDLQDFSQSIPVVFAAIGGLIFPAMIYTLFNYGHAGQNGWGIPMATDAAFAVGILALLRGHIPIALTSFLTALAIIDDIGAVLVIAVFYTDNIDIELLFTAGGILILLLLGNLAGIRHPLFYFFNGFCLWLAMLQSGVHASVSGILVALSIPAKPVLEPTKLVSRVESILSRLQHRVKNKESENILEDTRQHRLVEKVHKSAKLASTPLQRWTHTMQKPVTLFVMPLFALVNAGILINMETLSTTVSSRITWGIALGLLLGKIAGITLGGWLAIRTRLGTLPDGMQFSHLVGISILGAVGFTMSIFIAGLGLHPDTNQLDIAKTAILLSSIVAGILGYIWLRWVPDDSCE